MVSPTNNLGRLERVDLRHVWENEAGDFTPWLAQEENIALLSDTIGIDLEVEAQEKNVGPFRADILCKDTANDQWVLIENQLERTDHSHLGQLITYAAGLNAVTIVWIADRFTDERRAALDWLNEMSGENITFFGLEVELWRIGESDVAPKFNVKSSPNDWTKSVSGAAGKFAAGELTDTRLLQREYWTAFRDVMEQRGGVVKPTKPHPQGWQDFSIGRSGFWLETVMNTRDNRIGVMLVLGGSDAKAHFHLLHQDRDKFEKPLGELEWAENSDKKQSYIKIQWQDCDPTDKTDWPKQLEWLYERLQALHKTLSQSVRKLNADDYVPDNGEP